ncbi:head GIN domain-containing protein [Aquirufa sp. ROCK2-A2]
MDATFDKEQSSTTHCLNFKSYMMKSLIQKTFLLLLLLISVQSLWASDTNTRKVFKVAGFHSLEIGHAFEIHVKKSNNYSLVAIGNSEDIDELKVDISGNTLEVEYKNTGSWLNWNWGNGKNKIILEISMPELHSAYFSGATKVDIVGFNNEEDCKISVSGASKINIVDINADKLTFDISGAAKVTVSGQAIKLNFEASGASKLDAFDLFVRDADLGLSGASSAMVKVQKSLKVEASGASKVIYRGRPNVSKDISGASKVYAEN